MRKLAILIAIFGAAYVAAARTVWIDTDVSIGSPIREVDDAYALLLEKDAVIESASRANISIVAR